MRSRPLSAAQIAAIRAFSEAGHPRLFVGADDRELLLAKASSSDACRIIAEEFRAVCEGYFDPHGDACIRLDELAGHELLARPAVTRLALAIPDLAFGGWLWDEDRYTELARAILLRWAREAPPVDPGDDPEASGHMDSLDTGSVAIQLAWAADLLWPVLTEEERAEFVQHVRDYYIAFAMHPGYERHRWHQPGCNMSFSAMVGIGFLGLLIAEYLPDETLDYVIAEAIQACVGYLREGADDDGACYEGPAYGSELVSRIIEFGEALARHGLPELSQHPTLPRHARWLASIMVPGGGTIALGDSHTHGSVHPTMGLLARQTGDPGIEWAYRRGLARADHANGPFGRHRLFRQLCWYDPDREAVCPADLGWSPHWGATRSGFVTLRSDWSEEAVIAAVSGCGRSNGVGAHQGYEAGAVDLWAYGQELLYEPAYGYSTADAHSTVIVSDRAEEFSDAFAPYGARVSRYAEGGFGALTSVEMAQMRGCKWAARDVVFVNGPMPYLVVADDINYLDDWSEYDWFWQAHPDATVTLPDGESPARIIKDGVALDIFCLAPPAGTYPRDHEITWSVERADPISWCNRSIYTHHNWHTDLNRLRMHVAGYNGLAMTILVPRREGEAPPAVARLDCPEAGVGMRVDWGAYTDHVVFEPFNRVLQTDDLRGGGRLAVVREKEGNVARYALIDGYELSWRGEPLMPPRSRAGDVVSD